MNLSHFFFLQNLFYFFLPPKFFFNKFSLAQKAREAVDMHKLLDQVCFLSREVLRTQEKQDKISSLIESSSDSPRSSTSNPTSESTEAGDIVNTAKMFPYSRYYQYLTGMFSLSVVGVIIGNVTFNFSWKYFFCVG